jgi:hypothetical protein
MTPTPDYNNKLRELEQKKAYESVLKKIKEEDELRAYESGAPVIDVAMHRIVVEKAKRNQKRNEKLGSIKEQIYSAKKQLNAPGLNPAKKAFLKQQLTDSELELERFNDLGY